VLDAAADAGNRWIFPDAGEPHGPQRVLVTGSPRASVYVDVSGHVEAAVASLAEHRAYLEGLGDHPMADPSFLADHLHALGEDVGCEAALGAELFEF